MRFKPPDAHPRLNAFNDIHRFLLLKTYSPSGAPGRVFVYFLDFRFLERTTPSGFLNDSSEFLHCSLGTAFLKYCAASSQLSECLPSSTNFNHAFAVCTTAFSFDWSAITY